MMEAFIVLIILWIIPCLVVAAGASNRGRSGVGFFFLSLFLSPLIGVIVLFVLGETKDSKNERLAQQIKLQESIAKENSSALKKCPFCAEEIKQEAIVCKFCRKDLPQQ